MRDAVGCEFQFIIHTRTMPARRGHEITLLIDADQVRGLVNWSTGQSVNYLSTDPPPLWRMRDLLAPPVLIALLSAWRSEPALLLFLPTTFLYFLIAPIIRGAVRIWRSAAVGHALRDVQRAGSGCRSPATRRRPD